MWCVALIATYQTVFYDNKFPTQNGIEYIPDVENQ